MRINPEDLNDTHIGHLLYAVREHHYGGMPMVDAFRLRINEGRLCVWGYSVYRRSPGFRTMGEYLSSFVTANVKRNLAIWTTHDEAIADVVMRTAEGLPRAAWIKKSVKEGTLKLVANPVQPPEKV